MDSQHNQPKAVDTAHNNLPPPFSSIRPAPDSDDGPYSEDSDLEGIQGLVDDLTLNTPSDIEEVLELDYEAKDGIEELKTVEPKVGIEELYTDYSQGGQCAWGNTQPRKVAIPQGDPSRPLPDDQRRGKGAIPKEKRKKEKQV